MILSLIAIPIYLLNDISKQTLLNNSIIEILNIIGNSVSLDEIRLNHFNTCKNKIISMKYLRLYELFENSGKQPSDIGNFGDCIARNYSYYIINNIKNNENIENKAILYLKKNYSEFGLCIPAECNDTLYDFVNSKYFQKTYLVAQSSIFSYVPLPNGEKRKKNNKINKTEILSIGILAIILFLLCIKILTPIFFGTCFYKYSYLKYTKGNNFISVEDNLTDDDEEFFDDNEDNVQLFRASKLSEMKKEEEENHKNKILKSVIFRKNIQSFFCININLDLLISHQNFLYNNNLLQPISFFKSITLFLLFYNESFFALINLPMKNSTNEKFYFRWPMIWVKYSTFFFDVYIALEGFLFAYKLFN